MDYAAHYNRLILRAKGRVLKGYKERHHILPRCMGGGNEPENIAELTPEEHYLAHQLLVRINPRHIGLAWGAVNLAKRATGNKAYGWLRRRLSAAQRGRKISPESIAKSATAQRGTKRKPHTAEARAKIGAASKGNKYALGKRHTRSLEFRMKMVKANLGKRHSQETRAKISAVQIGKKLTAEHRAKIAAGMRGKQNCLGTKQSPETRAKRSATLCRPDIHAKLVASHLGLVPWNKGKTFTKER